MNNQRFRDDLENPEARIERSEGVLKDDLKFTASAAEFRAPHREQVAAFVPNGARSRFDEPQDQAAKRALAGAGFADKAQGFARFYVEGHIVDGAKLSTVGGAEGILPVRIHLGEGADGEERHGKRIPSKVGSQKSQAEFGSASDFRLVTFSYKGKGPRQWLRRPLFRAVNLRLPVAPA